MRGGGHAAVALRDGRVLVAGGWSRGSVTATAELVERDASRSHPARPMRTARAAFTATLLRDGRVLVAGGWDGARALASAEVFDPSTGSFAPVGQMRAPHAQHAAALLPDGRVLVTGGSDGEQVLASAELFDPAMGTFSLAGSLRVARHKHAMATLPDGRVLVLVGSDLRDWRGRLRSTELYLPSRNRFVRGAPMRARRFKIGNAVVSSGRELVVASGDERVEVYDPRSGRFRWARGTVGQERQFATATSLGGGRILIAGGYDAAIRPTARAWIYRR